MTNDNTWGFILDETDQINEDVESKVIIRISSR